MVLHCYTWYRVLDSVEWSCDTRWSEILPPTNRLGISKCKLVTRTAANKSTPLTFDQMMLSRKWCSPILLCSKTNWSYSKFLKIFLKPWKGLGQLWITWFCFITCAQSTGYFVRWLQLSHPIMISPDFSFCPPSRNRRRVAVWHWEERSRGRRNRGRRSEGGRRSRGGRRAESCVRWSGS